MKTIAGGSTIEAIAGIGAVVLAIIGLTRVLPSAMGAVATIIVGGALMVEGASLSSRLPRLTRETGREEAGLSGGMSAEFLGGIAGIVLGILSLIGVEPLTLLPVANIVFGAALLIGSVATSRIETLSTGVAERTAPVGALSAATGAQVLVGIGAIVLGILGVLGLQPLILSLVSLLAVGSSVLLSGSAISGKITSVMTSSHS